MAKKEPKKSIKKVVTPDAENPETKIKEITTDLAVMSKEAGKMAVKDEADVSSATEFLSKLKGRITRIEQLRKFFVDPLNKQVKEINAMFKPQTEQLESLMSGVKQLIVDFRHEEERKARVEEARLAKIREQANEKREEKGEVPISAPIKTVERSETLVKTESGKSSTKKVWKFKVVDLDKVPVQYLKREVSYSEVMGAISSGVTKIDGLEIYEDFVISVSSR